MARRKSKSTPKTPAEIARGLGRAQVIDLERAAHGGHVTAFTSSYEPPLVKLVKAPFNYELTKLGHEVLKHVHERQGNPVPVIGIAAAAATGTVAGFALGRKRKTKQQNPIGEIAAGVAVGAIAGGIAGYSLSVPDIDAKLDQAEKLIAENKPKEASDQMVEIVGDVEAIQSRLGGSAADIRRRLKVLNNRLPSKWQIFALQQNPEMAPKAVRALKNRLLR